MASWLIKGGQVVDQDGSRTADVRIVDGLITEVGENLSGDGASVIDAEGCVVSPGLVDIHTHLREPGAKKPKLSRPERGRPRWADTPPL